MFPPLPLTLPCGCTVRASCVACCSEGRHNIPGFATADPHGIYLGRYGDTHAENRDPYYGPEDNERDDRRG